MLKKWFLKLVTSRPLFKKIVANSPILDKLKEKVENDVKLEEAQRKWNEWMES
jgi:hypothetical protein